MALILAGAMLMAQVASAEDLAAQAGVDAADLQAAADTVGADPMTYLIHEGLVAPPPPPFGIWDRLAQCESGQHWAANTGNGYYGGLQEDLVFWRRHGGLAFALRPDLATRAQQITVAQRGLAVQGPRAWPVCSYAAGMR